MHLLSYRVKKITNRRILRVSQTWPSVEYPGKGLHGFHTSNHSKDKVLMITKATNERLLQPNNNVTLIPIKYLHHKFPKPGNSYLFSAISLFVYVVGQFQLLFSSLPYIKNFKPDIVHLQSPHTFLIAIFSKLIMKSKIVVTFHGGDIDRICNNNIFLYFLRRFDCFCYVSDEMISKIKHKVPRRIHHIQTNCGVDLDKFINTNPSQQRKKQILAIGSFRWEKDYPTMINAIKKVFFIYNDYELKIIGDGHLKDEIKLIIDKNNLAHRVKLCGIKSREYIVNEMVNSKLFLLSSVSEGMPKVILEARACSLPIVSTDVGACRKAVGNAGIIVRPRAPEMLANAILDILTNENKYNQYVENCSDGISEFSWATNTRKLEKIFSFLG